MLRPLDTHDDATPRSLAFACRDAWQRAWVKWSLAAAAIVLLRSALFILRPHVAFDSDQAVMGLMAKHLAEGRAFPLFIYGQSYMLGVEAWLAAPLMFLFGPSIAALKLPVVGLNVLIAVLLVRYLVRNGGVPPALALVASLFFLLPPPGTTAAFVESSGGNIEPLAYTLLLWAVRRRSGWFGLIAAIGILNREFTVYALAAMVLIEALTGELATGADVRRWLARGRVMFEVWLVFQWLKGFSSAAGPGTTPADLTTPATSVADLAQRFCIDPRMFVPGIERLVTIHWAGLFGGTALRMDDYGLVTKQSQGSAVIGWLLAIAVLGMAARVIARVRLDRAWWRRVAFPAYLTFAGGTSALVYALARCGHVALPTMRYDLMSVLGAVGLAGWFMAVEKRTAARLVAALVIVLWAAAAVVPHVRLWSEYGRDNPTDKMRIVQRLEARNVHYVKANYWLAYYITFVTGERIIATAEDYSRIRLYDREVDAHKAEAVRIQRDACEGGYGVMPGVYFCPVP